jgi:integrase
MATGIRKRHSTTCRSQEGGACSCTGGWEASAFDYRINKKIRKTFRSLSEARAWRSDQLVALRRGKHIAPSRVTLREASEEFLREAEEGTATTRGGRRYKPATLRSYRHALNERILPELGPLRLSEIRRADVQALADRILGSGLSPSSTHNALDPLRAIFRRAVMRETVAENPTANLDLPRPTGKRERIATPQEAAELLAALPISERALWATAFYAGLRRGELQALRATDVDLGRSEIRVERGWDQYEGPIAPKSDSSRRTVPLLAVLRDYLDEHLLRTGRKGEALVFGRTAEEPIYPATMRNRALRAWKGRKPISPHEARHTFASLLIDSGANVKAISEFMGHASIQETMDTYGHLLPGSRDEVRERMDSYLALCASNAPVTSPQEQFPAVTERAEEAEIPDS